MHVVQSRQAIEEVVKKPLSSDLMALLAEIEMEFPVGEWTVRGISIWPLLRIRWFFAEWHRIYATAPNPKKSSGEIISRLKQIFRGSMMSVSLDSQDDAYATRLKSQVDILFFSDGLSFSKIGSHWVDRFCDPLLAAAERENLVCASWTPTHNYQRPRSSATKFVQSSIDIANLFGAAQGKLLPALMHLPEHADVITYLEARGYGAAALQTAKIAVDGSRLRVLADTFRRRLARAAPRVAFIVSYYSLEGMAFVLACHELGIAVVDIQHGVQGQCHPAYWFSSTITVGHQSKLLPHYFWVWSNLEAEAIGRWSDGTPHTSLVGGNPWLCLWQPGSEWPGVAEAIDQARRLQTAAKGRPVVLITLQYGFAPSEQIEPLGRLLHEASESFYFWVRLHPLMLERRDEIKAQLPAVDYELDRCTDLPLHALLPFANVHMTHSSTTVIEAEQCGVPSVISSPYGAELFPQQIERGAAVVETGEGKQLVSTLRRLSGMKVAGSTSAPVLDEALRELLSDAGFRFKKVLA